MQQTERDALNNVNNTCHFLSSAIYLLAPCNSHTSTTDYGNCSYHHQTLFRRWQIIFFEYYIIFLTYIHTVIGVENVLT